MIGYLRGTIIKHDPKYVILDVAGVGYKVFTTAEIRPVEPSSSTSSPAATTTFWTYLAVRDDALDLYGFTTEAELAFFELLITISGIGPKTALGILSVATVETIYTAIHTEDTSHLTKVAGIGAKLADKIVRELKDKVADGHLARHMQAYGHAHGTDAQHESDTMEALKSLGYSQTESRNALKKLDKSIVDTGERVKAALKLLNK